MKTSLIDQKNYFCVFQRYTNVMLVCAMLGCTRPQTNGSEDGIAVCIVRDPSIKEASGLVVSSRNPGIFWTHNDSSPHLYAFRKTGELVTRIKVPDAAGGNFEDLAVGPGPMPGVDYLYLGDIGDNQRNRESVAVFRMPEPDLNIEAASKKPGSGKLHDVKKITLNYPNDRCNAESLFIDSITGDLFIATKEKRRSRIYTALKAQLESDAAITLKLVCELRSNSVSGASITRDGRQIALRNEDAAQLWTRQNGASVADAFYGVPTRISVIGRPKEPNGEAIAFDPFGHGYYTISEGLNPSLYFFNRP